MMFKRHQILLTEWQTDCLKKISKKEGISLCEALRIHLNAAILDKTVICIPRTESKREFEARKIAEKMK